MESIQQVIVQLDKEIHDFEIPLFRGAVNAVMERGHSILYHNHQNDGYRYSYPLIQYKRINRKAAIVCIGKGVDAIVEFLSVPTSILKIGQRTEEFTIESVQAEEQLTGIDNRMYSYNIANWLPFNSRNHTEFKSLCGLVAQIQMLEGILIGNILAFLKGIDVYVEDRIELFITHISEPKVVNHKGLSLISYDVDFKSNILLPNYIGLGKDSSIGHGVVVMNA